MRLDDAKEFPEQDGNDCLSMDELRDVDEFQSSLGLPDKSLPEAIASSPGRLDGRKKPHERPWIEIGLSVK